MTFSTRSWIGLLSFILLILPIGAMAHGEGYDEELHYEEWPIEEFQNIITPQGAEIRACTRANSRQIAAVDEGNRKRAQFVDYCARQTGGSGWCSQVLRPNPASKSTFSCTYGNSQVHQLIHPDESTWRNATQAIKLVERLQNLGIRVCQIYNWWRPEPYNKNVGGAAGRHPYGTSVDVRFCTKSDQNAAFSKLCQYRKKGEIRAIGYYGGTGLHFGIGDRVGNTWGRSCP